jgi:cysteinyl-tRNA synthetase
MLRVYNTLSRNKEEFVPRKENEVAVYVCGPTTYNFIHLGNARPMVVFDTVRRYLKYKGYKVTFVQNFTDVDDKIINRAREEGMDPAKLAEKYIQEYFIDAHSLNVEDPDIQPKVTEHMEEIISMVESLVNKGYAYESQGSVYFDVQSFSGYGKLSGRSLEDMKAGARVEVDETKRHPLDFALWKASKEGEPAWPSPWGMGRPGWHIECSAMSVKYLGSGFDIHGGGYDLVFPHHENEIAQAEAASSVEPFVKYWMHNGFITVNEEKMSKSLGNFFLVRDILDKFPGDVVRFFLLSTHYRSPIDFDDAKLTAVSKGLDRIKGAVASLKEALEELSESGSVDTEQTCETPEAEAFKEAIAAVYKEFNAAMDDDFNTALASAALFDFSKAVNTYLHACQGEKVADAGLLKQALEAYEVLAGDVLGVLFDAQPAVEEGEDTQLVEELMQLLLEIRESARSKKDWATADIIRDRLGEIGIEIQDTPKGPKWVSHGNK